METTKIKKDSTFMFFVKYWTGGYEIDFPSDICTLRKAFIYGLLFSIVTLPTTITSAYKKEYAERWVLITTSVVFYVFYGMNLSIWLEMQHKNPNSITLFDATVGALMIAIIWIGVV